MTPDQAASRVRMLGERNPTALSLAQVLAFAALAEPGLIRNMRLELAPGASASDEADLWFSNLVQSRSPRGLVFFPEVAEILRQGLTQERRGAAWDLTSRLHRAIPRALRIEEELTYLGLDAATNGPQIEKLLQAVVGALVKGRAELANWAGRALPRLPVTVRKMEAATLLGVAADLRTGRATNIRQSLVTFGRIPPWIATALPALGRVRLRVEFIDEELSLGPLVSDDDKSTADTIEVPNTATIPLEVRWSSPDGPSTTMVFLENGQATRMRRPDAAQIELVTLANETWTLRRAGDATSPNTAIPLALRAYTDGSAVVLHWRARDRIVGCLGFAVLRRRLITPSSEQGAPEEILLSRLGFAGSKGIAEPTTRAPLQRFSWIDRPTPREALYSYRVVPLVGKPNALVPNEALSSGWCAFVQLGPMKDGPILVESNRTLENAAQLNVARDQPSLRSTELFNSALAEPGNAIRTALGGDLLATLIGLLQQAVASSTTVYVAMFGLEDPQILELLQKLGSRANVILADEVEKAGNSRQRLQARNSLQASGAHVLNRASRSRRLAHNKFMVICDSSDKPTTVWTGNVTWASAALCARSNVAVTVENPQLAQAYLDYWQRLASEQPSDVFRAANTAAAVPLRAGSTTLRPYFSPQRNRADLEFVNQLIRNARQGVLFLLSEPGKTAAVVSTITAQDNIYILGAVRDGPSLTLFRNGKRTAVSGRSLSIPLFDSEAQPRGPRLPFGSTLQSRMILIDPLGSHPVVLIGSHSFGEKGSRDNDENFIVVENDTAVAQRCAAYVDAFCQHFSVQSRLSRADEPFALLSNDRWQAPALRRPAMQEAAFWMGEDSRTFLPQDSTTATPRPARQARTRIEKKTPPRAKTAKPPKPVRKKSRPPARKVVKKASKKK